MNSNKPQQSLGGGGGRPGPRPTQSNSGQRPGRGSNYTAPGSRPGRRPRNGSNQRALPDANAVPVNKSIYNGSEGRQITQAKGSPNQNRVANVITRQPKLKIIPLGGLGEIGKNMMAIEYENDIIVVDMGFGFPSAEQPGIDYIIPNTTYLEKNKHKLRAYVITHGHMDHIGAAGYVLPKLPAPVYGSRLSLGFVEKHLEEFRLQTQPQFRVIDPDKHEKIQLGVFKIELVRVNHTIPDGCAVAIETPVGTIIHTGDWKLDPDPVDGKLMDLPRFGELGKAGVLLLMSDSTRCDAPGRTPSERLIAPTFVDLFNRSKGRVIVSSFASSLTRVQLIVDAAAATGRKLAFNGRSMLANVELAVKLGYLRVPPGLIVKVQDSVKLPDNQFLVLCTGSQGELNSALTRMSTGDHPHIKIKPGDAVIYSSSAIPGNEKAVVATVDALMREGARVYQRNTAELDDHGILHVSGHAAQEDAADLIKLVKPKYFMPLHGEFHHLIRHAEVAVRCDVPMGNIFVLDNGDVLELTSDSAKKGERVPSGMIMIDGAGIGDVEGIVLRDRLAMASDGIFMVVATVDRRSGKLVGSPDIISRGFIYMKENEELIARARNEVRGVFERRNTKEPTDWPKFKLRVRDELSDFLYQRTKRNPMVITVVNEV